MWHQPAIPRHVVQVLAIDLKGKYLTIQRSNTVRSARNCWSFPTETHEIGETIEECAKRCLDEEFGLPRVLYVEQMLAYENIAGDTDSDEQYHWVIDFVMCVVPDLHLLVNKEPDKHSMISILPFHMICDFHKTHAYHPTMQKVLETQWNKIFFNHLLRSINPIR